MRSFILLLGIFTQCALAQTNPSHAPPNTQNAKPIEGQIARVDRDEFLLTVKGGTTETYQLSPAVQILRARRGSIADLSVGKRVRCIAVQSPGGALTATDCSIYPEGVGGPDEGHNVMPAPITSMTSGHITDVTVTQPNSAPRRDGNVMLQIAYSAGTQKMMVSSLTEIRLMSLADRSAVRPGARVRGVSQQAADGTGVVQALTVLSGDHASP
jgi:hypothetical protein